MEFNQPIENPANFRIPGNVTPNMSSITRLYCSLITGFPHSLAIYIYLAVSVYYQHQYFCIHLMQVQSRADSKRVRRDLFWSVLTIFNEREGGLFDI